MMQYMPAENAIGFGVGDELDHSFDVIAAKRAAVSAEREFADAHLNSLLLGLIFRETNARQLGIGVDDTGNGFVVHMAGFARDDFHASDSFVFGFVGQHRPGNHIAYGINTFDIRAEILVYFDSFFFIQRDTQFLRTQTIREWTT